MTEGGIFVNLEQMWALNSDRNSPDLPLKPGDKLSIGHKYQLRATDNFRYLSVQFATTRGVPRLRACMCGRASYARARAACQMPRRVFASMAARSCPLTLTLLVWQLRGGLLRRADVGRVWCVVWVDGWAATIEMLNYDLLAANSVIEEDTGSKLADKAPLAHWAGNEICILPHSCVDHATVVAT